MKGRLSVVVICLIGFVMARTSAHGAEMDPALEHKCAALYGTTGAALPALIREAIKVFPKDRFPLRPDQVVYITDFNHFVDCMGLTSETTRSLLFRQELLVFHNDFPIYLNANEDAVSLFRTDGRASYLKYIYASFIGKGWIHATGEKRDYPAYSFELSLLQSYKKLLPAGQWTKDHFDEVRSLMNEALAAEQKSSAGLVQTSQSH